MADINANASAAPVNSADSPRDRAVVASFEEQVSAESAVDALEQVGFTHDHIGYVARGADADRAGLLKGAHGVNDVRGAAAGVITGGIVGGVLATAVAILIPPFGPVIAGGLLASFFGGTLAGMAVGGIIGALKGMGISDEEARQYEREFNAGKAIVAVRAGPRAAEAAEILSRFGGAQIHSEGHSPIPTTGDFHMP